MCCKIFVLYTPFLQLESTIAKIKKGLKTQITQNKKMSTVKRPNKQNVPTNQAKKCPKQKVQKKKVPKPIWGVRFKFESNRHKLYYNLVSVLTGVTGLLHFSLVIVGLTMICNSGGGKWVISNLISDWGGVVVFNFLALSERGGW